VSSVASPGFSDGGGRIFKKGICNVICLRHRVVISLKSGNLELTGG